MTKEDKFRALMEHLIAEYDTQQALAAEIGVGVSAVSKWASGQIPRLINLSKLCRLANLAPADLDAADDAFLEKLASGVRGSGKRDAFFGIPAMDQAGGRRAAEIADIRGLYRYIYTLRHGAFCIGELEIVRPLPNGIHIRLLNLDDTADIVGSTYTYEGRGFIIEGFLYMILGEADRASELLTITARMPVGNNAGVLYGHLLARGFRDGGDRSAVSPVILVRKETMKPIHVGLIGEVDPATMIESKLLSHRGLTHLADVPNLALSRRLSELGALP